MLWLKGWCTSTIGHGVFSKKKSRSNWLSHTCIRRRIMANETTKSKGRWGWLLKYEQNFAIDSLTKRATEVASLASLCKVLWTGTLTSLEPDDFGGIFIASSLVFRGITVFSISTCLSGWAWPFWMILAAPPSVLCNMRRLRIKQD